MKFFVFLRGNPSELKTQTFEQITNTLHPGSFLNIDLERFDRENRKNAHRLSKEAIKEALVWPEPRVILITNPSLNPPDWDSYLSLGTTQTVSFGIDIYDPNDPNSNLQYRNVREFIVSVYKYHCVKMNEDIPLVVEDLIRLVSRGG